MTIRHNELRNLTGELLAEVCYDIKIEPQLTPLTGEKLSHKSSNQSDDARLDVPARGFSQRGGKAFLDIRVYNPLAKSYSSQDLNAAHRRNETEKKRQYGDRIRQIEHASFNPLVFTCFGGMAWECQMFNKRLSELLAEKRNTNLSLVTSWVRTRFSMSLLRTAILCLRSSRSRNHKTSYVTIVDTDIEVACVEAGIEY